MSFVKINLKYDNSTVTLAAIHFTWEIQLPLSNDKVLFKCMQYVSPRKKLIRSF